MIRVAEIQRTTAAHYGVPLGSMTRPMERRGRPLDDARPRQVAMLLAYRLTDHTLRRIGQMFGNRDHSTVIHAVHLVEGIPAARRDLRRITLELIHNTGANCGKSVLVSSADSWA